MRLGFLADLPMPPSINRSYAQVGHRRVATRDLRQFKTEVLAWSLRHSIAVTLTKRCLGLRKNPNLELALTFKFPRGRVMTKAGKPKRLDLTNRIKALEDAVAEVLGFDDCFVFKITAEKVITEIEVQSVDAQIIFS